MATAAAIVHVVAGDDFVADTELVEGHDIVHSFALECVQVLYGEDVVFVPFELQPWAIVDGGLDMTLVQQVIDALLVDLKVRAVDGESLFASRGLLFDQVEKKPNRPRNDALVFAGLKLCYGRFVCFN